MLGVRRVGQDMSDSTAITASLPDLSALNTIICGQLWWWQNCDWLFLELPYLEDIFLMEVEN